MVTSHISRLHHPNPESDSGIILSTRPQVLFDLDFVHLYMFSSVCVCVCVCVCVDLWNFIKWISPRDHHKQGTELFHWHKEIPSLPFPATPWTLTNCNHWFAFHHNNFDILRMIHKQCPYFFFIILACGYASFLLVSKYLEIYFYILFYSPSPPPPRYNIIPQLEYCIE